MIKEFRTFISRGSVVDLAVGVVVGGAFGKIVTSLVDNIIMPIIGLIIGGINFSNLAITYKSTVISYGLFIQNIIDFLIIAFCIFMVVKVINKITKKQDKKEETKKTDETVLLEEIRDLLKKQSKWLFFFYFNTKPAKVARTIINKKIIANAFWTFGFIIHLLLIL